MNWRPIETAPRDQVAGVDPLILIAHIRDDRVVWAVAARWTVEIYGYVQCASRSGWQTDYMPPIALAHNKPKHPGEWLFPDAAASPTHWMPLPEKITGAIDQTEEVAIAIWAVLCPGMVMGDADLPHYAAAAKAAMGELGIESLATSSDSSEERRG